MAQLKHRRSENVSGNFYVDSSCIDCDTCRWVAPKIYHRAAEKSAIYHQPVNDIERKQAMQALLACPTASIGTREKPTDIRAVQKTFPLAIEDNVYYCGYHSEKSYGAASYFIQRQEGNILVDSPRFTPPLVKRLEAMGGISHMYLTHKDDIADHQKFQAHFNCKRILHTDDITAQTQNVEIRISGDSPQQLATDLLIIPVPGHTKGHTVLLYKNKFLFTGDHLAWSSYLEQLYAFRRYCWYSWSEQVQSMEKLANYTFEWVLPGHGRRYHSENDLMQKQMEKCLNWMKNSDKVIS